MSDYAKLVVSKLNAGTPLNIAEQIYVASVVMIATVNKG